MIIGRVTFLIGKAIVVSLDGSSRELRLGDGIDSTETIEVSAGGEVVITDNNGVAVSIGGNESWAAQNGQFNELPEVESSEIDTSTIDPTSVEAIQAALLAGIDPTTIGEATAAGNQGGGDQQLGSEGSSFVRVGRGNTSSIDSGLDFDTIAQGANTLENSVFDTLLRAESSEPTGPFTGLSSTPPLTGFTAFDDVDSNGLAGSREVISNNSFTNDSTPIYSGSSTPGSIIRIYDNNVLVTTTTVDADGNWQIQSPELEDAVHSITVTAQQEGSTESAPNGPLNFTVDTSAPTQTAVISNVYDDVNGLSDIASGGTTDDTAPQLQGTLSAVLAGDEVLNVLRDNVVIGQAVVDATDPANVTWIFDDSALVDGVEYQYQVQVVDAAGNTGDLSNSYSINIIDADVSAPTQTAVISNVYDDVNGLSDIASGGTTDDTAPQLQGTLSAVLAGDEVLNVLRDNVVIGQAVVDATDPANVTWIFDDSALVDGVEYQYQVQVADAAGNTGDLSNSYSISINSSAPTQTAVISNVYDDVNGLSDIASGGTTDDTAPQLQGTLSAVLAGDEVLNVLRDNVVIGQAVVDATDPANVTWIFDDSALVDGVEYQYQVQVVDAAGNTGDLSNSYSINIIDADVSAPTQTAVISNVYDDVNGLSDIASGGTTDDTAPQLQGTLSAVLAGDEVLNVLRDNVVIGQAVVDATDPANVTWIFDDSALVDGVEYQYQVQVADAAGNTGDLSNSYSISINSSVPTQTAVISNVYDDVNGLSDIASGGTTDDTAPQLQGTLSAVLAGDEVLNVLRDNVVIGQAVVDATDPANVTWIFDDSALVDGVEYQYQVQVADAAGNTGDLSNSYSISINSSAPTQTAVISNVYDDVNGLSDIASGGTTDDTAPQLKGTLSAVLAGDEVLNVLRDNVVIGQAVVDATDPANVTWIFDDSALVDGVEYQYQVQVADAAGNTGDLSNSYSISINSSAPTQNISIDFITDNVDPQLGDFDSGSSTNDVTPLINGGIDQALAADEYIIVFRDGIEIGQAVVDSSDPNAITWSLLDDIAGNTLEDGESYQYTARVFDGSGNGGALSDVFDLSIDTTAPIAAIVDLSDNSDTFLDFFGAQIGSKTDDKTLDKQLEFNGQLSAADAGSVIVFYAYATQAKKEAGQISDTGEDRVLLDGVDSTAYSATNRFVLGTATVEADGKYVMRMEDTDGSPLLSSANAVYNGVLVDQYYLHVNAIVTDLAGNNSEVSDDLDITIDTRSANANTRDPLILDLNNDGTYTSSINRGVKFDHDGDGEKEHSGWVSANDGFLALDLNNDGEINNGSELFGNDTVLGTSSELAGDGFEALAQYDSDNNNVIDANDDVYDDLRVWIDQNQNGQSDDGELKTLSELNIESISLEATDTDDADHGNDIIKAGTFVQNGEVKSIVDADLAIGPDSGTASFIELLVDGNTSIEHSDNDESSSPSLKIKVTLPQTIINGDHLLVAVQTPTGVYNYAHQVVSEDSEQGFVMLSMANTTIEPQAVDGEYSLSLIVSSDSGATVVFSENVTYQVNQYDNAIEVALKDSINHSLEHSGLADLPLSTDAIDTKDAFEQSGNEFNTVNVPQNSIVSLLEDSSMVDLNAQQSVDIQSIETDTSELLASLDLFDNVSESDSLEQYFQFEQDGADLKVFVNESGGFTGQENVHETATDVFIVQNFSIGDSVYEDVINKVMANKVEIDS